MKTIRILSLAMTMAMGMIAGIQASVTEHQPPAPLPEFKTPEQLAKWRSETTTKTSAQEAPRPSTLDSSTPFYTGKPYLAESSSYAFKYREYNPEMGRWTTIDPSGFPDGANNYLYSNMPLNTVDSTGESNIILEAYTYAQVSYILNVSSGITITTAGATAYITSKLNSPPLATAALTLIAGLGAGLLSGDHQSPWYTTSDYNPPEPPPGYTLFGIYGPFNQTPPVMQKTNDLVIAKISSQTRNVTSIFAFIE